MREADSKEANIFSQPNDFELDYNANNNSPLHESFSHKLTNFTLLIIAGILIGFLSRKRLSRLARYLYNWVDIYLIFLSH